MHVELRNYFAYVISFLLWYRVGGFLNSRANLIFTAFSLAEQKELKLVGDVEHPADSFLVQTNPAWNIQGFIPSGLPMENRFFSTFRKVSEWVSEKA